MTACGGGAENGDNNSGDDVIVNEDVLVLDESARAALALFELDTTQNEGEIRFDASSSFAQSVNVGRILATQPVEGLAPYGFLQRVQSKRTQDGEIILETSQATLLETFDQADIRFQQRLTPNDTTGVQTLRQGVSISTGESTQTHRQALGYDFNIDFDRVLIDVDDDESTTDDQLTIDGGLLFNASARADIDIGFLAKLKNFVFEIEFEQQADIEILGNLDDSFDEEFQVASFEFATFTIFVGPVPVVFSVTLELDAGADGQIDVHFQAAANQETSLRLGARYTNSGGWRTINDADSSFNFSPPVLEAAGDIYAFAKPKVAVRIYGLAGPFVSASAFIEADAELYRNPFWRLGGGLDLGIGFEVVLPVVGNVARFERTFRLFREELDAAENRAPTLVLNEPTDGSRLEDGDRVSFRFDVRDREQTHVDVVVTDSSGSVVGERRVGDDESGLISTQPVCIGAETYRITATDDNGESTTEVVSVIVDNRIPNVSVDRGTAPSPFPGGYLVAFADVNDRTCESLDNAEPALIAWYANGQRVGSSDELLFRVPTSDYQAGDSLQLEARYDDGLDVGASGVDTISVIEKPAGLDIEPMAIIRRPVDGVQYLRGDAMLPFEGIGIDTEDGELNTLVWEIDYGVNNWIEISRNRSGEIDHFDIYGVNGAFGTHTLRLTVTDSAGQSIAETITYEIYPPG